MVFYLLIVMTVLQIPTIASCLINGASVMAMSWLSAYAFFMIYCILGIVDAYRSIKREEDLYETANDLYLFYSLDCLEHNDKVSKEKALAASNCAAKAIDTHDNLVDLFNKRLIPAKLVGIEKICK